MARPQMTFPKLPKGIFDNGTELYPTALDSQEIRTRDI